MITERITRYRCSFCPLLPQPGARPLGRRTDYAQQPDIRIAAETDTPKIYRADNGRLYTFLPALVTCPGCQARR